MKKFYLIIFSLLLLALCACTKEPLEAAPVQAEMPASAQEDPAPEEPAVSETEPPAQAALSGEEQAQLLRDLDARMQLHPAHPSLDMHWLDERAASQWLMFFQQQIGTYSPLLYGAAYEVDLYSLEGIGDYLGTLTFQDGSDSVYFKISIENDTVTALPAADGAQLLAAYESLLSSGAAETISPEALPEYYYEMILTSMEIAYPDGLYFESPAELSEQELYTSFQLFANQDDLLDCWNEQAGAYLFSEERICAVLDRYYQGYALHIEDDPLYDAAYHAIASQVVGGFGGGVHVSDVRLQADGNRYTICAAVRDGNGNPMGQKDYVLEFYDGGFYLCAIRDCTHGPQVSSAAMVDGVDVTYLEIPSPYQYLGDGVFYCYPDESRYADGAYYRYDWSSDQIMWLAVQQVEQVTPMGQVRFRWWSQGTSLGIHNLSDQQLLNNFSLEASLAYASALPDTSSKVLLTQGAGMGDVALGIMDLQTGAVEPLVTGAKQPVQDVACNRSLRRFLFRSEDGAYCLGDGQTVQPLAALTGAKSPITQAYWRDFQSENQIVFITQEPQERKSIWLYDCSSGEVTALLEDYLEYQGITDAQEQYVIVSSTYALRRMPDGTTYLVDLEAKEAQAMQGFTWDAGVFQGSIDDTALFLVRGEQGLVSLGLLDCQNGGFQLLHRQPDPSQQEEFGVIHFDRHTIGIQAQARSEQSGTAFVYVYKF